MLTYGFMQYALIVSVFIAVLCPMIGIFLILRRYSMIGDTLSHASLAGITIGLAVGGNPVIGAFLFTSVCGALIEFLRGYFRKNADLILSIVLALCVGTAITIMSSGRLHESADSFLFGSILTVKISDLVTVAVLSAVSVATLLLLYHQMLYIAYDEEAAKVAGVKVRVLNYVFLVLVAMAISVAIRIVGVLVISSMITLPVATAMQLGRGFKKTLVFSVVFSLIDVLAGLILSFYIGVAPGGFTALVSVFVLFMTMLCKKVVRK